MSTYSPKLPGRLATARAGAGDEPYLTQSRCVDWLLDCRGVCALPSLRSVIDNALGEIGHIGVVSGRYFRSVLDEIELALAVEAAFDPLELKAA